MRERKRAGRNKLRALAPLLLGLLVLFGCGGGGTTSSPPAPGSPAPSGGDRTAVGDGRGGVRLQKLGDFDQPLYVTQPPGDRHDLFVVEQTGGVMVLHDGKPVERPFLDLSDRVSCCGEQGLLSLAFAPDYRRTGLFYVDYTDTKGDTRVVEYERSADPLRADPGSAREVIGVDQPYPNHNGGLVAFGPDRLLYVGLGDGGSESDPDRVGQDLSTPLAKILRIDPHRSNGKPYSVPAGNPFADRSGARPETYAYGLRNPWRFSFDRSTDSIWIGDVGQSEWEEVDSLPLHDAAGANFGWSAYEARTRFNHDEQAPGQVSPVLVYSHSDGCSVTGGYVVRDRSLPSLYGRYLYGDFCAGQLRSFTAAPGQPASDDRSLGPRVPSLSSFGEDDAGHVYLTSLDGPVYRLLADG